jgi:hypothetical protein
MGVCASCGRRLSGTEAFCPRCGVAAGVASDRQEPQQTSAPPEGVSTTKKALGRGWGRGRLWFALLVVMAVVLGSAWFVGGPSRQSPPSDRELMALLNGRTVITKKGIFRDDKGTLDNWTAQDPKVVYFESRPYRTVWIKVRLNWYQPGWGSEPGSRYPFELELTVKRVSGGWECLGFSQVSVPM